MTRRIAQEKYNKSVVGAFGHFFTDEATPVFYLNTTISIENISWLKPVRDILDVSEVDFDELIQRDLDDYRIKSEISKYLIAAQGYKFFPPIVNAFVQSSEDRASIQHKYPKLNVRKISAGNEGSKLELDFQGAFLVRLFVDDEGGLDYSSVEIRWKDKGAELMAVDGQHRLVTLLAIRGELENKAQKGYYKNLTQYKDALKNIFVPITVLFFPLAASSIDYEDHQLLNKYFPNVKWEFDKGLKIKDILRSVFVDVNKNARNPSISRNILLDEKDLCAVFARKIFSSIKQADPMIYSNLLIYEASKNLDYQVPSNRPALSTIGIIFKICEYLFKDSKGDGRRAEHGQILRARFNLYEDTSIETSEVSLDQITATFFTFEQRIRITQIFESTWLQPFKELFIEFMPYKKLYEVVKAEYDQYREKYRNDLLDEEEEQVYKVMFGSNDQRFFYQQNSLSESEPNNANFRTIYRRVSKKDQALRNEVEMFEGFYTQMFQLGFFQFIEFVVSKRLHGTPHNYLPIENLKFLIAQLNQYLTLKPGSESIFNKSNTESNLIFNGENDPKYSNAVSALLGLVLINFSDPIVPNLYTSHLAIQDEIKLDILEYCVGIIEKYFSDSLQREYSNLPTTKQRKIDIEKAKEENNEIEVNNLVKTDNNLRSKYISERLPFHISKLKENMGISTI